MEAIDSDRRGRARSEVVSGWPAGGVPATAGSLHTGDRVAQRDAAHERRLAHTAQWTIGLGLSGRAVAWHGILVVAGFEAHRLSAVRYQPRARVSSGGPARRPRQARAGALSESRRPERRCARRRGSGPPRPNTMDGSRPDPWIPHHPRRLAARPFAPPPPAIEPPAEPTRPGD